MQEVSRQEVITSLKQVGISRGDGLLVHSALQFLGRPTESVGMYLNALHEVVGLFGGKPVGTLAVPTFNFSFATSEEYDPATAPAVGMGAFSEYIRQHPDAWRTTHPMQSFALIGAYAEEFSKLDTSSAFDDGSAVDCMLAEDFKLLLLGADIQAVSALHYGEQRVGVPYRYWKVFSGRVKSGAEWQAADYKMYVRDMDIDARLEIYGIETVLRARGLWQSVKLNYGYISACRLSDFVDVTSELLSVDPWCFVTNKPEAGR